MILACVATYVCKRNGIQIHSTLLHYVGWNNSSHPNWIQCIACRPTLKFFTAQMPFPQPTASKHWEKVWHTATTLLVQAYPVFPEKWLLKWREKSGFIMYVHWVNSKYGFITEQPNNYTHVKYSRIIVIEWLIQFHIRELHCLLHPHGRPTTFVSIPTGLLWHPFHAHAVPVECVGVPVQLYQFHIHYCSWIFPLHF